MKLLSFLFLVFAAVIMTGCGAAMDVWDGEPRYDTEGTKTDGRNLNIDEVLEYQTVMAIVRDLETKPLISENSALINSRGQLKGLIPNNSNQRFNVKIVNSRGKTVYSGNIAPHSYIETYLTAGEYTAYFDGGKSFYCFKVMPDVISNYELVYKDGSKEVLDVHWYLYKDW